MGRGQRPDAATRSWPTAAARPGPSTTSGRPRSAGVLAGTGLPREARVAVLLPDGVAVHVAFVAAERAGLTVVGLGHRAGDDEIRHLLGLTRADALVTLAEHRGRPTAELVDLLRSRRDARSATTSSSTTTASPVDPRRRRPPISPGRAYGPDDLFLINSTSGTTGMPKCVHAHPEPVDVLPPARGRGRRHDRPTTCSSARSPRRSGSASGPRTSPPRSWVRRRSCTSASTPTR